MALVLVNPIQLFRCKAERCRRGTNMLSVRPRKQTGFMSAQAVTSGVMRETLVLILILAGFLAGCGGGTSSSINPSPSPQPPPPPTGPPTLFLTPGNWFILNSRANVGVSAAGDISQNGAAVTGFQVTVSGDTSNPIFDCWGPVNRVAMTGIVGGNVLQLTAVSPTNPAQTLTITLTGTGQQLTGSYIFTGGSCLNGSQGNVTSAFVPSMTGVWKGSLTSSVGAVTQVTATLTQGPTMVVNGVRIFTVSGGAVFTGSGCVGTTTVDVADSFIVGEGASLIFKDTSPSAGQLTLGVATNAPAGTTLNGSYNAGVSCGGETGSATLTRQ